MNIDAKYFTYEDEPHVFIRLKGLDDVNNEFMCDIKQNSNLIDNKEIILVADVSGSMYKHLNMLKLSLISFKNIIGSNIPITLIIFNDTPRVYKDDINNIIAGGNTDIGKSLTMAINMSSHDKMTWIILFTDGEPTRGIKSIEGFKLLTNTKHYLTKIMCAGFTSKSPSDILISLGDFRYIERVNMIDTFFKTIAYEIINATVSNVKVGNKVLSEVIYAGCDRSYAIKNALKVLEITYFNINDGVIYHYYIDRSNNVLIDDEINDALMKNIMIDALDEMREKKDTCDDFEKYKNNILMTIKDKGNLKQLTTMVLAFESLENKNIYNNILSLERHQSNCTNMQTTFVRENSMTIPLF